MKSARISPYNFISLLLVIASFLLTAVLYSRLPDPVPTHWNMDWQADGFTPKPWGAFLLPLVMAGLFLVLLILPAISPRGFAIGRFVRVYEILQVAILAFLFSVNVILLLAAAGVSVPGNRLIPAIVGALLIVLGNFLGKVTKNFFVGIRTPWTLASDEVWLRTHRLGGKLFVLAGVILLLASLFGTGLQALPVVAVAALIAVVYSYVIYRRIEGFPKGSEKESEAPR